MGTKRLSSLALVFVWTAAVACEDGPPKPPKPPENSAERGPGSMGSAAPGQLEAELAGLTQDAQAPRSAAAASAVAALRDRTLPIPPREAPAQRITFSKDRIAQLGDNELVVRSVKDWQVSARVPVEDARAVTTLADGTLLAVGGRGLYHLEHGAGSAKLYPRVPLLPGSLVFGDRREKQQFWVLQTLSSALSRYELTQSAGSLLGMADFFELEGLGRGPFVVLKDGSFLYAVANRLERVFPRGKQTKLELPRQSGEVWRLLTTRRIDQVWVARSRGALELVQIAPQLNVVRSIEQPLPPYDVASSDSYVASLCIETPAGQARRFTLIVWDAQGHQKLKLGLSSDPAPGRGDDWVSVVTREKTLALSNNPPFVAIGGPTRLSVWDVKSGRQVL